ncbi:hypothetical protein SUGI_0476520 [Cryptomeria japonica]|nr:hypothetical protein SUGI_0476520 [Cryptomeria japonica]
MGLQFLLLFSLGLVCVLWVYRSKKGNRKQISGSMGWPFIGETISLYLSMSSGRLQQFVAQRQQRYGRIFASHLFGRRVIISTDYDLNKYLMNNEGRITEACYAKGVVDLFGKYGMICINGDLHKKLRGIAVSLTKLENLRTHFMEDIHFIVQSSLSTWNGKDILLQKECHKMNLRLIAKQLLGLTDPREIDEIDDLYGDFTGAFLSPPWKIPGTGYAKGHRARKLLIKKIHEIIEQKKAQTNVMHNDFVTKLLTEYSLADEVVAEFLLFMLFAGHETSSRAMVLSVKYLTDCPKALEQLRVSTIELLSLFFFYSSLYSYVMRGL